MTHPEPRIAEALLAETAWLHSLARRLVGVADGAEDAAQDSLVTAMRRPPERDESARGWLMVVLRNHLRLRGRAEARRRTREQVAARSRKHAPATADVAGRMDAAQHVLDAVRSLREPYQTTIVLRFLEELAPREVASRMGVPMKTAQTRIDRGLEHLRRRLDRSATGGREAWLSSLAPIAWPHDGERIAKGVITMGSRWKQGAALAALVLVVGGGARFVMGEGVSESSATDAAHPGLEAPGQSAFGPAVDSQPGRVPLAAAPEAEMSSQPSRSQDEPETPKGASPSFRTGRVASRPPSTVQLVGGATYIGSTAEEIQALVLKDPSLNRFLRSMDAETPRFQTSLVPFHLGITEVTNEQYAMFVRTTGHRPPSGWGSREALDEAQRAFITQDAEARQAARARGEPTPRRQRFDRDAWWSDHWEGARWDVPEGADREPVLYVDFADAEAYCAWAGLRLPTEFEYQHACRGTSTSRYPWGDEWADGQPPDGESETSVADVAGTREGVASQGIHDLAGNVWEWTTSPYIPYPGFEEKTYQIEKVEDGQKVLLTSTPATHWDVAQRVLAGGSFLNSPIATRCTTRRPTEPTQRSDAAGFRVAASVRPGVDVARRIARDLQDSSAVPVDVSYRPDGSAGLDRWWVVDGAAGAPARYQVVVGYDHFIFVPVEEFEFSTGNPGSGDTPTALRHLGFLSTSLALTEPALPAGTYLVALEEGLVLLDVETGEVVHRFSGQEATSADGPGENGIVREEPWLRLSIEVPLTQPRRVVRIGLDLRPDPGFWDGPWRD